MFYAIGIVVVFGCVATGYAMHGGYFPILWQPSEVVIIFGAAMGATIIGQPGHVLKGMLKGLGKVMKGAPYKKKHYIDTLMFMLNICKVMKTKGMLEVEPALDNPHESDLFNDYPLFAKDHHAVEFFCDYMRLVTMGMENHYQLDDLMDKEIENHHHAAEEPAAAWTTVGDGLPALGIVAAILGVIITMGSITEPPEILGGLIGAALVGSFLGILMGYGLVAPTGCIMTNIAKMETEYYVVLKTAIISHIQGNAPVITVEFARKAIPNNFRPSFNEIDALINGSPEG